MSESRDGSAEGSREHIEGTIPGFQGHQNIPAPESTASPAGWDLGPGCEFGGYRLETVLGVGGMGAVYLATDLQLGRKVAIKTMRAELATDPDAKARFLQEARSAAAIQHEHVVAIYAVGEV